MVNEHLPNSLSGIADIVKASHQVRIEGPPSSLLKLRLEMYSGVLEMHPADQVLKVRAGTKLRDVQDALEEHGLCLPIGPSTPGDAASRSIGCLIGANHPHTLEAQCGSWRDWVLGMTVVTAEGTIARSGSMAVKNVAGYDVHKLFIGSRGKLGVIADVILRAYPTAALPGEHVEQRGEPEEFRSVTRTLRSRWSEALSVTSTGLADHASCTFWSDQTAEDRRTTESWTISLVRCETDAHNQHGTDGQWDVRAKSLFDPTGKFV